jgi:hypothetical protein
MDRQSFFLIFVSFLIAIVLPGRQLKAQGNPTPVWSGPDKVEDMGLTLNADKRIPVSSTVKFLKGYITSIAPESAKHREARHRKIARRRVGPVVIVHRGAWAFAPENTLEAYSAAMDYGADGCEIDIRRTADGVLVMFHDDGLD